MTKKFGDHKLDKYIGQTGTAGKRYEAQHKGPNGPRYEVATIKEARTLVSYNPLGWRLAAEIGRQCGSSVKPATGVQARPPAAPAAKVHVPKGGGKKPTPPKNQAWPFPAAPAPVAAPVIHSIRIGNVIVEYDEGIKIHHYNKSYVRLVKA